MSEFKDDFTWSYAQTNAREDIASIFNHTTDPASVDKWKTRIQKSPVFRKKFYFMVASCLESGTEKFWDDLFHFTDAQWREIRDCRIDIPRRTGLLIRYTKADPSRYGNQLRTAMALMNLDARLIQASGIQEINYVQSGRPKRRRRTLTINDLDVDGLLESIFLELAEKHRRKAAAAGLSGSMTDWAVLFRRCVLDVRGTAVGMSRAPVLFDKIRKIRNFTASWLPENFWTEMMDYQKDIEREEQYQRHFQKCGLRLNVSLPPGIKGEICRPEEIANASRVLTACCSVLSVDFIRDTGIRKIAFAKNMLSGRRKIIGGYVSNRTLCLDPSFAHLGRTVFYEFFKAYDPRAKSIHDEWNQLKGGSADCISRLAGQSVLNDRADTFAWLLWDPCHVYRMARKSPKLLRKTELVLSLPILTPDAQERLKLRYYRDNIP